MLLFAAVLCAVCVLGCRAVRSLSCPPCAVLRCTVLMQFVVLFAWYVLFLAPGAAVRCCQSCIFLRCCAVLLRAVPRRPGARCVVLRPAARLAGRPVVRPCSPLVPCSPVLCPVVLCCRVVLWCPGLLPCLFSCMRWFAFSYFETRKICSNIFLAFENKITLYTTQHARLQAARPCLHHIGLTCDPAMVAVSWMASALWSW